MERKEKSPIQSFRVIGTTEERNRLKQEGLTDITWMLTREKAQTNQR